MSYSPRKENIKAFKDEKPEEKEKRSGDHLKPWQFKKGQSGFKGRVHKFKIADVHHVLAQNNINPTEEILKLIPMLDFSEQIKAWFLLLSYTQPKPAPIEMKTIDAVNELVEKMQDITTEELVNIFTSDDKAKE